MTDSKKLYTNTKLRTLTFEGGTTSDNAILMWNQMNWEERAAVMENVKSFKSLALYNRACINYVAEFLL